MAIYSRTWKDDRVYFSTDNGLIKDQKANLVIKLFGIPIISRVVDFTAEKIEENKKLGFNSK